MEVRMLFGKHKGKYLRDIPGDYLAWVRDNCDLRPTLREAIDRVLFGEDPQQAYVRGYHDGQAAAQRLSEPVVGQEASHVLQKWYREMCIKHHPDRGGSKEVMSALNDLRDRFSNLFNRSKP